MHGLVPGCVVWLCVCALYVVCMCVVCECVCALYVVCMCVVCECVCVVGVTSECDRCVCIVRTCVNFCVMCELYTCICHRMSVWRIAITVF